ncbi:hypothetical protein SAMN05444678_101217 [Sphingomonas sp. YR710]|jgi:hypothetical protein|uniref:hypothetical protein n=1 Tax=Sphingomonas sp. YR710 TaxID=1882773 RepID=UPI00088B6FEB|nr:hypothetical protein [Sphingomonas sp. YR710]SDC04776.1 hypothetical protein SAMN05444678_101217 [Sphingomonas sp. YR710]
MDRATEAAIKAVLLGLHRSKAISTGQIVAVADELAFAARNIEGDDPQAATEISDLAEWFRKAITPKPDSKRGLLSRF